MKQFKVYTGWFPQGVLYDAEVFDYEPGEDGVLRVFEKKGKSKKTIALYSDWNFVFEFDDSLHFNPGTGEHRRYKEESSEAEVRRLHKRVDSKGVETE